MDTMISQCHLCPHRARTATELVIDRGTVYWRGTELLLTVGEYRVLDHMVSRPGTWVTYREVYDIVHYPGFIGGHGDEGYKSNVRSLVKRLRNKFRAVDPIFDRIANYCGHGYRWENR